MNLNFRYSHPRLVIANKPDADPAATSACMDCKGRKACLAGGLDGDELVDFEQLITLRRRVARREVLVRVNEPATKLYAVHFGQFKATAIDHRGQHYVAGFHMSGDLIGVDAFAGGRHRLGAVALEDSEVCEIPIEHLSKALTLHPALASVFLSRMSANIFRAIEGGQFLASLRSDRRFARFLCQLSERHGAMGYSPYVFHLRMARADIGSYLGISVENLSRMIAKFRQHGLVNMNLRRVEILDLNALVEFSNRNDVGD